MFLAKILETSDSIGSTPAALSCLACVPPREEPRGRSAGFFPEQRLVMEPTDSTA